MMKSARTTLYSSWIETKLGKMYALSDESALYLLEFEDHKNLECQVESILVHKNAERMQDENDISRLLRDELEAYFEGKLQAFRTPVSLIGTQFQQLVWQGLMRIPYGRTKSYKEQAEAMGKPKSYRAVANANRANKIAIIVPCHRIIGSNGALVGYAGGITRKRHLIEHETSFTGCAQGMHLFPIYM